MNELKAFSMIVVDPDHVPSPPKAARAEDSTRQSPWIAYVALGEVNASRRYHGKIPKSWFLGKNPVWGSGVLDQTPEAWPDFFLAQVIKPLWDAGYRGFFLDALDSYQLYVADPQAQARQVDGMIAVIRRLKKAHPEARLILNRGFEMLPEVHSEITAVAFESLFRSWDQSKRKFVEVPEEDRIVLLEKARGISKTYGLPIVSIDYVPAADRELARATADRIKAVGLIPWVSTPELDVLGVGAVEVQPRKILMLYDSQESKRLIGLPIHRFADAMVTHLGYVPEYRDIRLPHPDFNTSGRYAGILCWLSSGHQPVGPDMCKWLLTQTAQGMKMVLLGELPFPATGAFAEALGLKAGTASKRDTLARIAGVDSVMSFEMRPQPDAHAFFPIRTEGGRPLLRIVGNLNDTMVAAAYMPWGGYALNPYVLRDLPDRDHQRWILQPMEFLSKAMGLVTLPAPDLTSENGVRLLMVHVDGDGFANRAEWYPNPFGGEVLEKEIVTKYPFATTFSIIEGEVSDSGMYPALSKDLIPIARRILALPNVEIASHTYSHPFDWGKFAEGGADARESHLDIKGYRFGPGQFAREVKGSIDYINQHLAPKGKACKVLLWSGNCDPDARTVGLAYAAGVANMNGGETVISDANDSWTGIAPIGQDKGGFYQIYGPNQNENMYTGNWTGPFYGYANVIETFERTDHPIRFKPVDIYYHSYSGTKIASLASLRKVYDWALSQDLFNIYVSEYTPKVLDFVSMSLARSDSGWEIKGQGALRELRIPASMGYPDLARSRGIAGYRDIRGNRYVHLTGEEAACLQFSSHPPRDPFLWSANGSLSGWEKRKGGFKTALAGHLDLEFTLAHANGCDVTADGKSLSGKNAGEDRIEYRLASRRAEVEVACRP